MNIDRIFLLTPQAPYLSHAVRLFPVEWSALGLFSHHAFLTGKQLSEKLEISPAGVAPILERLIKMNLVHEPEMSLLEYENSLEAHSAATEEPTEEVSQEPASESAVEEPPAEESPSPETPPVPPKPDYSPRSSLLGFLSAGKQPPPVEPAASEPVPAPTEAEQPVAPEPVPAPTEAEQPVAPEPVPAPTEAEQPVAPEPVPAPTEAEQPVAPEAVPEPAEAEHPVAPEPVPEPVEAEQPVAPEPVLETPEAEHPVAPEPAEAEHPVAPEPVPLPPAPPAKSGFAIDSVIAFVRENNREGLPGHLAVYNMFLHLPQQLIQHSGWTVIEIDKTQAVTENTSLAIAFAQAAEKVVGKPFVPA